MGIAKSGAAGSFYQKVGPIIGRRHMGQNLITALHYKSNKPPTTKQLNEQFKFGLLNGILGKIDILVNAGFKHYSKNKKPLNVAYTYNYKHAFLENDGLFLINYPNIVYSRGHIVTPEGAQAIAGTDNHIEFSWLPQTQSNYCQYTDLATFLIYNPAKGRAIKAINIVDRYALNHEVEIATDFKGDTVHCYMSFSNANGKLVGDSIYIGSVVC